MMISVKENLLTDNQENRDILRFQDITKIYSGTIALRSVNITVRKGEVHGIIGKNGAGKTTLVGVMSGIIAPTEGRVVINDKKFKTLSRIRAKKRGDRNRHPGTRGHSGLERCRKSVYA